MHLEIKVPDDPLIWISDVTKRYDGGQAAADGVSLAVADGEAVAVMGPSGSGKSTLLNLIAGLDRPTSGTVTVAGQRIDSLSETGVARFRRQRDRDDLPVLQPARRPDRRRQRAAARAAGRACPGARPRARADELLAALRIERHRDAYPGRLSGGERQRVAIARALVNRPALLLADEPTGALDTATGEEIGELLLELNQSGQTLILVTHNPDLAARYASRTVQLVDGRIASDTGTGAPATAGQRRQRRYGDEGRAGRPGGARRAGPPPGADHRDRPGAAGVDRRVRAGPRPWWWTPAPRSTTRSPRSAARM